MSYALFATPLSSQQQLAPRSPLPPTISLRDAARPDRYDADAAAEEGSPHGKKPSNSEVLRRAPDAPETLLPHSAWSTGRRASATARRGRRRRAASSEFDAFSPSRAARLARTRPGQAVLEREVFHVKHPYEKTERRNRASDGRRRRARCFT